MMFVPEASDATLGKMPDATFAHLSGFFRNFRYTVTATPSFIQAEKRGVIYHVVQGKDGLHVYLGKYVCSQDFISLNWRNEAAAANAEVYDNFGNKTIDSVEFIERLLNDVLCSWGPNYGQRPYVPPAQRYHRY